MRRERRCGADRGERSGAGGDAGLRAELGEAEGKHGLGHKEDAVQPCLAAGRTAMALRDPVLGCL